MSISFGVGYPKAVKLRSVAIALLAGVSVTPTGWSRTAPTRGVGSSISAAQPARLGVSPGASGNGLGNAIALGSIHWDGAQASALDTAGQRHLLTLDRSLQETATRLLRTARPTRGAIVVISASDGRVLALSEQPASVPFSQSLVWSAITPSASLFKLVTTAALVERAQIQPDHRVCTEGGEHRLETRHLSAPRNGRVICSEFVEILASSRNAAYARLVHSHLSPDDLENFADRFGFNAPLPADVPAELGRFRGASEPLALVRTATGFVGSSLSALGAAYLAFVIARGGMSYGVKLLETSEDVGAPSLGSAEAVQAHSMTEPGAHRPERVIAPSTVSRLRDMMERVVSHGTAADAFRDGSGRPMLPQIRIAGKTGTLGRDEHTASWFVGFAPSRDPKVVIAVLLDNGAVWHKTAKLIAGTLLQKYFEAPR
ncbi:MAG: penicillin-binding transpeptidase domain-containing protein [Myxococcales bacterium]